MKKDSELYKKIRVHCYIVGLIAFLTALIVGVFLLHNLEKDEKTTGKYMAQITEKRVRARLDQYSMLSALLGNYISAGENLDENTFSELAEKIPNEDGVIKAFELAPEGIVTDIYPKEGNEGAFGLDMLQEHERKKDAILARDSGKYTLGGPYQLKQGGTGALLFNPVYQDNNSEQGEFWGFVILVIDWDRFIGEINLDYLSDADFCYRIWTYDRSSDKIILNDQEKHSQKAPDEQHIQPASQRQRHGGRGRADRRLAVASRARARGPRAPACGRAQMLPLRKEAPRV